MAQAIGTTRGRLLIGGAWEDGPDTEEVFNPSDDAPVGTVVLGTRDDVGRAVSAAVRSLSTPFPAHARYRVLMEAARLLEEAGEEIAHAIASEGSKTIREARREPPRAADVLRLSADASRRISGRTLPFDSKPGSEDRVGYVERMPVGVVAAILPFNDPLAVAAHKVGPALAAGNAVVVKPDSRTPFSVIRLAEILLDAGLPEGRINLVTGDGAEVGDALVRDGRVRLVSFTGGVATGRKIAAAAGIRKLVLELGANSAVIVMGDADLDRAVPAIVSGAFAQAGQNCLGVQRVLAHADVYEALKARLVAATESLKTGHSLDGTVDVCAMIRREQAKRVEAWIAEAVQGGAHLLTGGARTGALLTPAILERIPVGCRLDCDEVYGPVMSLTRVGSLDEAIERANAVDFGLHAAIFTARLDQALEAARRLQVGGVMINDSTDYRLDTMPFGGVKSSGIGREGIESAMESMTEEKVICFRP